MADAIWFLLITAIGIPVGGLINAQITARISRTTSRDTALLSAAQKKRDAEITHVRAAQDDLLEVATAVQSLVWYVDKETRLKTTISTEEWRESREFIERAVVGAQKLRAIARTMPSVELRDAYVAVERLVMAVVRGSNDEDAPDPWHEDVTGPQPDTITRAVQGTADAIKTLYDTYPAELGAKPAQPKLANNPSTKAISSPDSTPGP
jgi:hypothetical protein